MSTRKKWATQITGEALAAYRSQSAAYEVVQAVLRNPAAHSSAGKGRLTVYVDERDGRGWQTYEKFDIGNGSTL